MTSRRRRLDAELMRRGLVASRSEAKKLIEDRLVLVGGTVAERPSRQVLPADALEVSPGRPRFVSRGGDKLEAALDAFGIDPRLQRVIDVGASTGGFTDCLLQRGAARVAAVDVGSNQVHERLRADQRVQCLERTDVRRLDPAVVGGPAPLVVADVSFISLRLIVAELCRLSSSDVVVLVKPQFEAGKTEADRGRGVIRDPEVWRKALRDVIAAFEGADGALRGVLASPLLGARGNVEFFVYVSVSRLESCGAGDADAAVERAVAAGLALRARAAARPGTIAERA